MKTMAHRYHDISVGHRVVGHEGKCRYLHGHNYRVHFSIESPELDPVGRVIDFSVIKEKLCMWLEDNWDHKFLAWERDNLLRRLLGTAISQEDETFLNDSVVWVSFNPTAENMAEFLLLRVGPAQLKGTGCSLTSVTVEETRKCGVTCNLEA